MAAPLSKSRSDEPQLRGVRKKRLACDVCHASKVRCSGGTVCGTCSRLNAECVYSFSSVLGRPKNRAKKRKVGASRAEDATDTGVTPNQADGGATATAEDLDTRGFLSALGLAENSYYNDMSLWSHRSALAFPSTHSPYGHSTNAPDWPEDAMRSISQSSLSEILPGSSPDPAEPMSCPQPLPDSPAHRAETVVPQLSCDCLQRSTKVLSGVKALEMNVRFQVDAALLYIRTATTTWVQVLQCASCQRGNGEEILYISLSGVRAALRYLVAIFSSELNELTTHPPSPGCRLHVAQSPLTPQEMPIGDDCKPFSRRVSSAIGKSTLGGYDIDSDEQELLVRFIAIRLVRDMRDALSVLEGRIEEQNSAATWLAQPTGVLADNSALLQPLLRGVKELASSLQKSLCISSTAEIQRHF